jgi:predicted nucleic-acid-binding Zn-ribbon protein
MKVTNKCPKCGSTEIIADATALDYSQTIIQELTVATFARPKAVIFKKKQTSTVSAWVCGDCGYLELYADSPSSLKVPKGEI